MNQLARAILAVSLISSAGVARAAPTAALPKVNVDKDEFTLVVIPDTQRYALYFPDIFYAQTRWIKEHCAELNTKFVIHLGDVVDEQTDEEWAVADRAFKDLDDAAPYLVVPGNHDMAKDEQGQLTRNTVQIQRGVLALPVSGPAMVRRAQGATSDNSFAYFDAAGRHFMVVGLEFGPTDETLQWADTLISNHSDNHLVILATHAYMYDDDTRLGDGDRWSPKIAPCRVERRRGHMGEADQASRQRVHGAQRACQGRRRGRAGESKRQRRTVIQMLSNYYNSWATEAKVGSASCTSSRPTACSRCTPTRRG